MERPYIAACHDVWSLRYAGVDVRPILKIRTASLYVMRWLVTLDNKQVYVGKNTDDCHFVTFLWGRGSGVEIMIITMLTRSSATPKQLISRAWPFKVIQGHSRSQAKVRLHVVI